MAERPTCAICAKRRPERFCPAKGEKICAPCCGREREVTLDCPPDCAYLIAAHRYEQEHRKPLAESEVPFPGVEFSSRLIYEREPFVSGLAFSISQFAASHPDLTDEQALTAGQYRAEVDEGIRWAQQVGVTAVPTFVLANAAAARNDGYLQGRYLPSFRCWLATSHLAKPSRSRSRTVVSDFNGGRGTGMGSPR